MLHLSPLELAFLILLGYVVIGILYASYRFVDNTRKRIESARWVRQQILKEDPNSHPFLYTFDIYDEYRKHHVAVKPLIPLVSNPEALDAELRKQLLPRFEWEFIILWTAELCSGIVNLVSRLVQAVGARLWRFLDGAP